MRRDGTIEPFELALAMRRPRPKRMGLLARLWARFSRPGGERW